MTESNTTVESWKDAFFASPGPKSFKKAAILSFKGLCMGSADIIPGVSGGTIALITGIYKEFLQAIKSANMKMVQKILRFDFKGALAELHIRFLISLFLGIGVAIISLARLMNYLLHHHPEYTWSLFFGLIAASILVVGKKVGTWNGGTVISFAAGAVAAYIVVNLVPVSTPEALWFIYISGLIAICAMILPGLSGAFILLILGKYEFITGTLKNPFLSDNIIIIFVFILGCLTGLLGFSRVLNYLLQKYYNLSLAFLTGLMAGSMKKIWPWKEVLVSEIIRGKEHVITHQNIFPREINTELFFAIMLIVAGLAAVIFLERMSSETKA